jgi:hypothetical protein
MEARLLSGAQDCKLARWRNQSQRNSLGCSMRPVGGGEFVHGGIDKEIDRCRRETEVLADSPACVSVRCPDQTFLFTPREPDADHLINLEAHAQNGPVQGGMNDGNGGVELLPGQGPALVRAVTGERQERSVPMRATIGRRDSVASQLVFGKILEETPDTGAILGQIRPICRVHHLLVECQHRINALKSVPKRVLSPVLAKRIHGVGIISDNTGNMAQDKTCVLGSDRATNILNAAQKIRLGTCIFQCLRLPDNAPWRCCIQCHS